MQWAKSKVICCDSSSSFTKVKSGWLISFRQMSGTLWLEGRSHALLTDALCKNLKGQHKPSHGNYFIDSACKKLSRSTLFFDIFVIYKWGLKRVIWRPKSHSGLNIKRIRKWSRKRLSKKVPIGANKIIKNNDFQEDYWHCFETL